MDAYRFALDQARRDLAEAQVLLKAQSLRVSQLESMVTQLEAFTGAGQAVPNPSQMEIPKLAEAPIHVDITPNGPTIPPTLAKAIINALNGKKGNFTVPEAIAALERTGRIMQSPNRNNIVRNTLIQNKAFGRLSAGHYYVKGFEVENVEAKEKEPPK